MRIAAGLGLLLLASSPLLAQPYDASWHTVDGGGGQASTAGGFDVAGTAGQPDASYALSGGGFAVAGGFWAILGVPQGGPSADLSISKTNGTASSTAGLPVTYTIVVGNAGPSPVSGGSMTDAVPATLLGAAWTCAASPGSTCGPGGSGSINDTIALLVGGTATYTLTGTLDVAASGLLVNTAIVTASPGTTDPNGANNVATDTDTILGGIAAEGELVHGYVRQHDLAAGPGPVADIDLYRILQRPHSSYEVLLDGSSGDIGSGAGPLLKRVASDGTTVLQVSGPAGVGGSRSLSFMNSQDAAVATELVRVESAGCSTDCDAADVYRLSVFETTGVIARFNNSGTQITVLVLQNAGATALDVDIRFWSAAGAPIGGPGLQTLSPHQSFVLNTSTVAPGSGSITVAHTGRRGQLAGKAVAVEPATGFTFDTELLSRPR